MKKVSRLIQLLPTSLLANFPTHLTGELASGVLANWTAAWHPLLISHANGAPIVHGAQQTAVDEEDDYEDYLIDDGDHEDSFEDIDDANSTSETVFAAEFWRDSLVFVPTVSLECIEEGFAAAAVSENAKLVTGLTDRDEIVARAFKLLAEDDSVGEPANREPAISQPGIPESQRLATVDDFYALAYAYLQVQLLTRKVRYSSTLDQEAFDKRLLEAATAYSGGDDAKCDAAITACYDLLFEEKNNYYPVKPALVDLVLTLPKTLGEKFEQEVVSKHPINFLMTGESLEVIAGSALAELKNKLADNQASIVGGPQTDLPDVLLSPESTVNQLSRGLSAFQSKLNYELGVFMRRRFGLMPGLPNILDQFNFNGALHTSLDGGKFPIGTADTMRWAGTAGASVVACGETVMDAGDPATFLDLGVKIGKQIDSSHEATCTLAHWPQAAHWGMADLIRVATRSAVLGEFVTLDDHFETLYDPGYDDSFTSEDYASPFLREAIVSKSKVPLSRFVDYWRQYFSLNQIKGLIAMWTAASLAEKSFPPLAAVEQWLEKCDGWQTQIETATADWNDDRTGSLDDELQQGLEALVNDFSKAALKDPASGYSAGHSLINPLFFTRRGAAEVTADQQGEAFQKSKKPYRVQHRSAGRQHVIAELGGTSLTPVETNAPAVPIRKEPPVLASGTDGNDGTLQNEFFVASIDRKTGSLRSIQLHGQRGNRASQRLVLHDKSSATASTMVCDSWEATSADHVSCQIETAGRILVGDQKVASFSQLFRLTRGRPVLEMEIEIHPEIELGHSSKKYFAHRLAWRDEACKLFGSDQFTRTELYAPRIESPNFVEVENLDYSLTLLPGGLPYHNRIERRQLDTLLLVGSEQQRKFKLGLGVDLAYPLKSAIEFACPALVAAATPAKTKQFFHVDSKNILVTDIRPVFNHDEQDAGQRRGLVNAFDFRLHETQQRSGDVTLFVPFGVSKVQRTNFHRDVVETLFEDGAKPINQIKIPYAEGDYFQIRLFVAAGK